MPSASRPSVTSAGPTGVSCPHSDSRDVVQDGKDDTQPNRQRYDCRACSRRFDDLTGTVFAGRHQPLQTWILCLYLMELNLSTYQIAKELELDRGDVQAMTTALREGIVTRRPGPALADSVECDEVYVVPGHKGNPQAVKKRRAGRRRRLKEERGRGTLAKEKPPIFGMLQRGGEVVIRMLGNVQQVTIGPLIERTIAKVSTLYTDEYDIYSRLSEWGSIHETVCHAAGEFARDDDGDGFCEVPVNTLEGFWSLLRSWLRPHRGISQEKLPLYLGFFAFVHDVRARGKALLRELIGLLVSSPRIPA
jgi:transposase-like protein